jgi:hypothetical protein
MLRNLKSVMGMVLLCVAGARRAAADTSGFGVALESPAQVFTTGGPMSWSTVSVANPVQPADTWLQVGASAAVEESWIETVVQGPASVYFKAEGVAIVRPPGLFAELVGANGAEDWYLSVPAGPQTLRWISWPQRTGRLFTLYIEPSVPLTEFLNLPPGTFLTSPAEWIPFTGSAPVPLRGKAVLRVPPGLQTGAWPVPTLELRWSGEAKVSVMTDGFYHGYNSLTGFTPELDNTILYRPGAYLAWESGASAYCGAGSHVLTVGYATSLAEAPRFATLNEITLQELDNAVPPGVWANLPANEILEDLLMPGTWIPSGSRSITGCGNCYAQSVFTGPGRLSFTASASGTPRPEWPPAISGGFVGGRHFAPGASPREMDILLPAGDHVVSWTNVDFFNNGECFSISNIALRNDAFARWSIGLGMQGEDGGAYGDPDGDGLCNLMEYVSRTNPSIKNASPISWSMENERLVFSLPAEPVTADGISVGIESSRDLGEWQPVVAGLKQWIAGDSLKLSVPRVPGSESGYFRLRVALP